MDLGRQVRPLGIRRTGSQIAVWVRAQDDKRPVVFFGSEGGLGVLTATPQAFALALAHAPYFDGFDEPARWRGARSTPSCSNGSRLVPRTGADLGRAGLPWANCRHAITIL